MRDISFYLVSEVVDQNFWFNLEAMMVMFMSSRREPLPLSLLYRRSTVLARDMHFLLSPGRLHLEMCVDRSVVSYGEKLDLHVAISNSTNNTIRKIKCQLIQVSLLPFIDERRMTFSYLWKHQILSHSSQSVPRYLVLY